MDKKLDRYVNAVSIFGSGSSRYVENKQLQRDLKFMNKKYDEGGIILLRTISGLK